jgi:hypothetical protein
MPRHFVALPAFHVACLVLTALAASCGGRAAQKVSADSAFALEIARLSEPGGAFDTDNLISNEASYLHVLDQLRDRGVSGGAYIGVGPEQNFSYIAHLRPSVAYILDVRRDNMLQHLMFKALFTLSRNRMEYLCLLFGRPAPADLETWTARDVDDLLGYLERTAATAHSVTRARAAMDRTIAAFGVPLTPRDSATIDRFHREFIHAGLALRFHSAGRTPRFFYPTYRDLALERDRSGRRASYLATEEAFQVVQSLERRDLVIPVVGDFAGPHALDAIGRAIASRGEHVSVFYTSNVEFYLFRSGVFPAFARNVETLPAADDAVIVRSLFHNTLGIVHPQTVPGYYSTQLLQPLAVFLRDATDDGGYHGYWDLVTRGELD